MNKVIETDLGHTEIRPYLIISSNPRTLDTKVSLEMHIFRKNVSYGTIRKSKNVAQLVVLVFYLHFSSQPQCFQHCAVGIGVMVAVREEFWVYITLSQHTAIATLFIICQCLVLSVREIFSNKFSCDSANTCNGTSFKFQNVPATETYG
uniref:Uncharacterized protein n=1 Tax=Glossina palpalis gambiensis TaxID=67801 RepID=A0A1B0AUQ4_9MUSC